MDKTMRFRFQSDAEPKPRDVLREVYTALEGTGYNRLEQLVGYLLTGELAYIPRCNDARQWVKQVPRDKLIKELLCCHPCVTGEAEDESARSDEGKEARRKKLKKAEHGPLDET